LKIEAGQKKKSFSHNHLRLVPSFIQGDTKKRELLKNPTKIEEIQKKKNH